MIAVDDATPQGMKEEDCKDFTEFPLIYEGKNVPIHCWLTHPEAPVSYRYTDPDTKDADMTNVYHHHDGKTYARMMW